MKIEIELRPHVGERRQAGGQVVSVEFDQYMIIATGDAEFEKARGRKEELLGFVGKTPGCPVNFLKVVLAFGDEAKPVFEQAVREQLVLLKMEALAGYQEQKAEAEALLKQAEQAFGQAGDEEEAGLAQDAVAQAMSAISVADSGVAKAEELLKAEQEAARSASQPQRAKVEAVQADRESGQLGTPEDDAVNAAAEEHL